MKDVIERAVSRWGLRNPTPDDVLMQECPDYHISEGDTVLYHSLASQVIERAVEDGLLETNRLARCKNCDKQLGRYQRMYCSRKCTAGHQRKTKRKPRFCTVCGEEIPRGQFETGTQYARRMYCSTECRLTGRRAITDEVRREIEALYAAGVSVKEISERLSYHRATIYSALQK